MIRTDHDVDRAAGRALVREVFPPLVELISTVLGTNVLAAASETKPNGPES